MDNKGFPFEVVTRTARELVHFTCFVCHLIFRDPVQSQLCGHRYCRKCHESYLKDEVKRECPQCKAEDPANVEMLERGQVFVDRAFKRECDKIPAKCIENGCPWTGPLGNYEEHERVCVYKTVKCNACGKMIALGNMDKHKSDDCQEASVKCSKCGKMMLKKTIQSHEELCLGNLADDSVGAGDVRCVISGCGKMVPRKKMEAHKKEQTVDHIDRMNESIVSLEHRYEKLILEFDKKIFDLAQPRMTSGNQGAAAAEVAVAGATSDAHVAAKAMEKASQLESVCTVMNQEFKRCLQEVKALTAECAEQKNRGDRLEIEIKGLERQLMIKDVTLAEQDMRVQMLENAFYDGVLVWKLNDFARRRQEAIMQKTNSIYSSPFFTSRTGYKLCARVYLNGDGMGKNTHISLFIVVMKGPYDALLRWPFQQKVTLTIIDQAGKDHVVDAFQPDTASSSFKRPTSDMNIASGCPLFMPLTYLDMKGRDYVKDDCLFIKVVVDTRDLTV